jgi:hypothetical protein
LLTLFLACSFFSSWWWRRYFPTTFQFLQEVHGITSQRTEFFIYIVLNLLFQLPYLNLV